jgi:hypothetical protein
MSDPSTTQPVRGEPNPHVPADPLPFLRITGTYPAPGGRAQTIQMDLNLPDNMDVALDTEPVDGQTKSWFTDFVSCVVAAMRRGEAPPEHRLVFTPATIPSRLFHGVKRAESCDGERGQTLPLIDPAAPDAAEQPADAAGQTGGH